MNANEIIRKVDEFLAVATPEQLAALEKAFSTVMPGDIEADEYFRYFEPDYCDNEDIDVNRYISNAIIIGTLWNGGNDFGIPSGHTLYAASKIIENEDLPQIPDSIICAA